MKKLTTERANELKANGITHIASICKSVFNTEYFKLESIETILANDGRMPKYYMFHDMRGAHYIPGINGKNIDWKHTIRWTQI